MMNDESTRFDDALRGHHRASLEQLSPKVRAQLVQRRHAALRASSPPRRHGFGYAAAGFAALCALAIGVQFRTPPGTGVVKDTQDRMLTSTTASPAGADGIILDQDPDFYAWLASSDAEQVAME